MPRRKKKTVPNQDAKKTVPAPRTKMEQTDKALKGYIKSFEIGIKNNKDPLVQLQSTRIAIEHHFKTILNDTKGFKFVETLKVTFTKLSNGGVIYKTGYFNSKAKIIINENEIHEELQTSKQQILNGIGVWISEGSGWTIKTVNNHYINIVNYKPLKGSSYIQLPPELRNSAKGLINMKNTDSECFRWCHIRNLNPQEKYPQRIKKCDKEFIEKLDYSNIFFHYYKNAPSL